MLLLALAGTLLCAGVALHEWFYHQTHRHASGVSMVLVVLAIGAGLVGLSIVAFAWPLYQESQRRRFDWDRMRQLSDSTEDE